VITLNLQVMTAVITDARQQRIELFIIAFAAISFILFNMFTVTTSVGFIITALILFGIAVGLFFPPNMSQILTDGGAKGEGVVSSVMMTIRNTGSVLGVALFSTIVVQVILGLSPHATTATADAIPVHVFTAGFQAAFIVGIVLSIATLVLSVLIVKRKSVPLSGET
jgi:hypothetical protein